jgi:hypothetical protein
MTHTTDFSPHLKLISAMGRFMASRPHHCANPAASERRVLQIFVGDVHIT